MELTARSIPRHRKVSGTGLETILDVVSVISLIVGGLLAVTVVILSGGRALLPVLSILAGAFLNSLCYCGVWLSTSGYKKRSLAWITKAASQALTWMLS